MISANNTAHGAIGQKGTEAARPLMVWHTVCGTRIALPASDSWGGWILADQSNPTG